MIEQEHVDELAKYKELLDRGIISDEEFQQYKADVLAAFDRGSQNCADAKGNPVEQQASSNQNKDIRKVTYGKSILVLSIIGLLISLPIAFSSLEGGNGSYVLNSYFEAGFLFGKWTSLVSALSAILVIVGYFAKRKIFFILGLAAAIVSIVVLIMLCFAYAIVLFFAILPLFLPSPVLSLIAASLGIKQSKS